MSKIIEINSCLDCKYCEEDGWGEIRYYCHPELRKKHLGKILYIGGNKIPDECPLDSVKI